MLGSRDSAPGAFLAGLAMMMVASFSPYLVLRLLPVAEAHLAGTLEGASQHVTRRLGRAAIAGRSFLGSEGVDAVGSDLSALSPKNSLPPYMGHEPSWDYLNDQSESAGAWEVYGDYLESRGFERPATTDSEAQTGFKEERADDL